MAWHDDSWKDGYDSWKLASPEEEMCEHEDFSVDILTGRAECDRCPHSWYAGEDEIKRQIQHEADYYEHMEREERRQWWRDLWSSIKSIIPRRKHIVDDDIPF